MRSAAANKMADGVVISWPQLRVRYKYDFGLLWDLYYGSLTCLFVNVILLFELTINRHTSVGRDNEVGTATCSSLEGPGWNATGDGGRFSTPSRLALGPTQPPTQ